MILCKDCEKPKFRADISCCCNECYKKLKAENEKLRECVEFYADKDVYVSAELEMVIDFNGEKQYCEEFGTKARQTLRELDENVTNSTQN